MKWAPLPKPTPFIKQPNQFTKPGAKQSRRTKDGKQPNQYTKAKEAAEAAAAAAAAATAVAGGGGGEASWVNPCDGQPKPKRRNQYTRAVNPVIPKGKLKASPVKEEGVPKRRNQYTRAVNPVIPKGKLKSAAAHDVPLAVSLVRRR